VTIPDRPPAARWVNPLDDRCSDASLRQLAVDLIDLRALRPTATTTDHAEVRDWSVW
jgi:hypothetical protein